MNPSRAIHLAMPRQLYPREFENRAAILPAGPLGAIPTATGFVRPDDPPFDELALTLGAGERITVVPTTSLN